MALSGRLIRLTCPSLPGREEMKEKVQSDVEDHRANHPCSTEVISNTTEKVPDHGMLVKPLRKLITSCSRAIVILVSTAAGEKKIKRIP